MKKKLILIGGGGHCASCIDVIEQEGQYEIYGILDSKFTTDTIISGYRVVGDDKEIGKYAKRGFHFLIVVGHLGNSEVRKRLYKLVLSCGGQPATIISPRAYVAKSAKVSQGSIVMHDALINVGATVGVNCIINTKSLIEHNCTIGAHCHISTGAVVNGDVTIGSGTFFGSNATCKQGITVKKDSFIKAGGCHIPSRKKYAFLTTIFPAAEPFLDDFFESLSNQTIKEFDVLVLNDGYDDLKTFKERFSSLNILEIAPAGSIAKNRQVLIQYALDRGYDVAVFGDSDDFFSEDRIEVAIKKLETADIVVNDLSTVTSEGKKLKSNIFSQRLQNNEKVLFNFIIDKNIFGFSNTAINLKNVPITLINFPKDVEVVDWYFFSSVLLLNMRAIFTSESTTFYRQHDANIAGINNYDSRKIQKVIDVKMLHYKFMKEFDNAYERLFNEMKLLQKKILNEALLADLVAYNQDEVINPLWWEIKYKELQ